MATEAQRHGGKRSECYPERSEEAEETEEAKEIVLCFFGFLCFLCFLSLVALWLSESNGDDVVMRKAKRSRSERGQAATELAFLIPLLLLILFGAFQVARVFYLYHTLQKALRGGAGLLARSASVNYCDASDAALTDARNFMVFGNLQGLGTPVVQGLTPEMIQILPERTGPDSTAVTECLCTEEAESCDVSAGGRAPDFIVVNLVNGFPMPVLFPLINLGTMNLRVSVRMPVTGS